jgi:hypothetical protein
MVGPVSWCRRVTLPRSLTQLCVSCKIGNCAIGWEPTACEKSMMNVPPVLLLLKLWQFIEQLLIARNWERV